MTSDSELFESLWEMKPGCGGSDLLKLVRRAPRMSKNPQ
jgi:hypothetical protein